MKLVPHPRLATYRREATRGRLTDCRRSRPMSVRSLRCSPPATVSSGLARTACFTYTHPDLVPLDYRHRDGSDDARVNALR